MDSLIDQIGQALAGVFESPVVQLAIGGALAYVTLVWLASAYWVLQDLRRRHEDPALPFVAAAGVVLASPVLFPLALVVYRIVRPGETLSEGRERRLSERLEQLDGEFSSSCPGCLRPVAEDWLHCPACRTRLAHQCATCGRAMGLDWTLCGWCGEEFGHPVLPERLPKAVRDAAERERKARRGQLQPGATPAPAGQALEPGA